MADNPLIAAPQSVFEGTQWFAGAGGIDSGVGIFKDLVLDHDFSALTVGVDSLAFGLDVLSAVLNPFGELVKAGVGWVLEHVAFLREPLELLTGDHRAILAVSQTWDKIGKKLTETAGQYEHAMSTVAGWTGDAAQSYRAAAAEYIQGLRALAGHADSTSQGVAIAGVVVATERAIIFDIISSFVSRVITEALIAAASSVVTLGGSVAAFLTSVSVDATLLATRLAKRLAKLLTVIKRFAKKFDELSAASKNVSKALEGKSQSIHNWADRLERSNVRTKRDLLPEGSKALTYTRYADGATTGIGGTIADNRPLFTGKEGAKAGKENRKELGDG
ncbi:PPE domain-containing protein [Actinoplanes palleronii]|uniref:PPE domain-containing protein n=1 Tax=Actinoplanes palleronii TaxID=113570 RepID=UPI0019454DF8|nr:PPE domain-containing protein [Actinoplanes palleronii]